jgi:transposase InsO family protein
MPWKETRVMDERLELVRAVSEGSSIAESARALGVSRKTAHKWLARFETEGAAGLADLPRTPHTSPSALGDAVIERILGARIAHPTWGPRKLLYWLQRQEPSSAWPAASTIGALLKARGLTVNRRRKRGVHPRCEPLAHCDACNRVWCVDFKGWFHTGDGVRCDPLTISDGYSRYLLCLQALAHPTHAAVQPFFDAVFRAYGLPVAIRSDNGVPFASTAGIGLSRLSLWWIELGITPERIDKGKPQQNGRHERMHKTLKADTLKPPAATLRQQQEVFERFRTEYNDDRPHEALDNKTPASVYTPSPRPYPAVLPNPDYDPAAKVCRVYDKGSFYHQGYNYFLADVLGGKEIALMPSPDDKHLDIYYRHVRIALLDLEQKRVCPAPRRKEALEGEDMKDNNEIRNNV